VADQLYSALGFDPFPVVASGQALDPLGRDSSSLTLSTINWILNTDGGQPAGTEQTGVVRLAIPLGDDYLALYQNTTLIKPTLAEGKGEDETDAALGAGEYAIYIDYNDSDFANRGLTLEAAVNPNFCPLYPTVSPSSCSSPICHTPRSGQTSTYLMVTVSSATPDQPLPFDKMQNVEILILNGIVSNLPGETVIYLATYDVVDGHWATCPSDIVVIPASKLARQPGVTNLRAEPEMQFLAAGDAPADVKLEWDYSDGDLQHILPTATLTYGAAGQASTTIDLDETALRRGEQVLSGLPASTLWVKLDYTLAGQGTSFQIGGSVGLSVPIIAAEAVLYDTKLAGLVRGFGAITTLDKGTYTADGDGLLFCRLQVTGDPTSSSNPVNAYIKVTQGNSEFSIATRLTLQISGTSPAASGSMTQTTSELIPISATVPFTVDFVEEKEGLNTWQCLWVPLGTATVSTS